MCTKRGLLQEPGTVRIMTLLLNFLEERVVFHMSRVRPLKKSGNLLNRRKTLLSNNAHCWAIQVE